MEKKMTSGEIAKKTGVSQKAIRLYDEKGLLKPTEYSEGNYRLYDKEALIVLEKIIALKQIGFSLEEIHDNLAADKDVNITEALAEGGSVNLYFEDVEEQETWNGINAKASYDCIIAHYLISFLKDAESMHSG